MTMIKAENKNLRLKCPVCGMLIWLSRLEKTHTPTLYEQHKNKGRGARGFSFEIIGWDVETLKLLKMALTRALGEYEKIEKSMAKHVVHDNKSDWRSVLNTDTRPVKNPVMPNGAGMSGYKEHAELMEELKQVLAKRRID